MARAKELLDLITSPTAVVTGVLLAFARGQLSRNKNGVERGMTGWALVSSIAGFAIAVGLIVVMTPLAFGVAFKNDGPVQTRLLVYALTYFVAIGTAGYAAYIAWKCKKDEWP